jgi:salicylate hydroxylase
MGNDHFSIIGGGIAGLAAAIAIAKSGRSVTIYEKAQQFEKIGAGIQLGPNAARALKKLGAWDTILPSTYAPPAIHMRDGRNGELLKEIKLDQNFETRFGEKYLVAHRADLHAALFDVASKYKSIEFKMEQEVFMADWRSSGPVIGADGIWSPSRENLFPDSKAQVAREKFFRSLAPIPVVLGISMECVNLWFYPRGHIVHYPVSENRELNLVAVTDGTAPDDFFANSTLSLNKLINQIQDWSEWPATYVQPLPSWSFKESALIIGDAAHGTLPYMAQGAAMALEDAAALGEVLKFHKTLTQAFMALYRQRSYRTHKLHKASISAGRIYHLSGIAASARNIVIRKIPSQQHLNRLAWIYEGN